jgi:hypothetical protein
VKVTTDPFSEHAELPESMENVTGSLDEAVAATV